MLLPSRTSLFGSCLPFVAWLWLLTFFSCCSGWQCRPMSWTRLHRSEWYWRCAGLCTVGARVQQNLLLSLVQVEMVGQLPHSTGESIFIAVYSALGDFFRPTPSWLPPGRYTCSIAAKRWIVIIMQGCLLVDSHKSTGSGPVRSPASCPSKKPKNHNQKQRNQANQKHTTTNQNKTKTQRSGIATSNGNDMHDDILCVIMRMATEQEAKQRNTESHKGPGKRW